VGGYWQGGAPGTQQLPFNLSSNSTIWYELHAREWPFKTQPAEAIIWQMGTGMKPNLSQIGMGKEISVSAVMVPDLEDQGREKQTQPWGFFSPCVKVTSAFSEAVHGLEFSEQGLCTMPAIPGACHQGRSNTCQAFLSKGLQSQSQ
jgi:hypothetical protein